MQPTDILSKLTQNQKHHPILLLEKGRNCYLLHLSSTMQRQLPLYRHYNRFTAANAGTLLRRQSMCQIHQDPPSTPLRSSLGMWESPRSVKTGSCHQTSSKAEKGSASNKLWGWLHADFPTSLFTSAHWTNQSLFLCKIKMIIKTEPTSQSLDFQSNFWEVGSQWRGFLFMLLQLFLWQCSNQWL